MFKFFLFCCIIIIIDAFLLVKHKKLAKTKDSNILDYVKTQPKPPLNAVLAPYNKNTYNPDRFPLNVQSNNEKDLDRFNYMNTATQYPTINFNIDVDQQDRSDSFGNSLERDVQSLNFGGVSTQYSDPLDIFADTHDLLDQDQSQNLFHHHDSSHTFGHHKNKHPFMNKDDQFQYKYDNKENEKKYSQPSEYENMKPHPKYLTRIKKHKYNNSYRYKRRRYNPL